MNFFLLCAAQGYYQLMCQAMPDIFQSMSSADTQRYYNLSKERDKLLAQYANVPADHVRDILWDLFYKYTIFQLHQPRPTPPVNTDDGM